MSVVERVEELIAESTPESPFAGALVASVNHGDLRALLALVEVVKAFEDYGDSINQSDDDPEDPDVLSKLTELSVNVRTALEAVTGRNT